MVNTGASSTCSIPSSLMAGHRKVIFLVIGLGNKLDLPVLQLPQVYSIRPKEIVFDGFRLSVFLGKHAQGFTKQHAVGLLSHGALRHKSAFLIDPPEQLVPHLVQVAGLAEPLSSPDLGQSARRFANGYFQLLFQPAEDPGNAGISVIELSGMIRLKRFRCTAGTNPHNGLSPSSYSPCTAHNRKSL